jgi:hypothetical protein
MFVLVHWSVDLIFICVQFKLGSKLLPPLNLVLWPFSMAEYYIKWSITKKSL